MVDEADQRPAVVYVEDDPELFALVQIRLRPKYHMLWAKSDEEACALFKHWAGRLRAVMMDIELAGSRLDGLQLVRLLRGTLPPHHRPDYADDVPKMQVPIIVLTAYTARFTEADAVAAGGSYFFTKPIDFVRLNRLLADAAHAVPHAQT